MPLEFAITPIKLQKVEGSQSRTQTVSFNTKVLNAQTALQGFSLDFEGVTEFKIDKVQVNTKTVRRAGNDVEVEVAVNYSDKATNEYNATITVLIIAEVEPVPVP